jgi:hypothetical protein
MTKGLLISRSQKITLHKLAIKHRTPEHTTTYRKYRNLYNSLIKASKKLYFQKSFNESKGNPKNTWRLIGEALNNQKPQQKVEKIQTTNGVSASPQKIAEEFNKFFVEAGVKIAKALPPTTTTVEEFLPPPTNHTLQFRTISQAEVVSTMRAMESKSSIDSEGISIKLLKSIAIEISKPLTIIFNKSIQTGKFPSELKTSRVVPIFKGGDPTTCDNYRPIALLSSLSKTLEKIVANRLSDHLSSHHLLYHGQFGFQRMRNTEQNLIRVVNYISESLNNKEYCIGLFLDLKKAFDVCSHEILLKKLKNMGVGGLEAKWFESYLEGRKQFVEVGAARSCIRSLNISVIQGSILGPILFNIFINDLPLATNLHVSLFADDTQALASGKNLPSLITHINSEIKKLAKWFRANRLAVNTNKTKYIIFHTKGKNVDNIGQGVVFDNNEPGGHDPSLITPLERIHNNHPQKEHQSYKLLGILLDEHLSFEQNTTALLAKLSKAAHFMNKVKHIIPTKALIALYYSLGHCHLTYCPIIASCTSNTNIAKIAKAQKKLIRIACNKSYTAHTQPLFYEHEILTYHNILHQAKMHFMHSIHYNHAPQTFIGTWTRNEARETGHELRNYNEYTLPKVNYTFIKNTPLYTLPHTWNTAGPEKHHQNWITFKTSLKEILLMQQSPNTP